LTIDKPKPIIEKIILTEQQQQEVNDILDGKPTRIMVEIWQKRDIPQMSERSYRPGSIHGRKDIVKKNYYHGLCHRCQDWPLYKVIYPLDGAKLVEYFCTKHFPSELSKSN
jgi:hypothetical protein